MTIVEVALACPLYQTFDYIIPEHEPVASAEKLVGARAQVMFGSRKMIGLITALKSTSEFPLDRLRPINKLIDQTPILSESLLQLAEWISRYYHEPIGEVLSLFLPALLRQGESLERYQLHLRLSDKGREWLSKAESKRARVKYAMLESLIDDDWVDASLLREAFPTYQHSHRRDLLTNGLIEEKEFQQEETISPPANWVPSDQQPFKLSDAQKRAVDQFIDGPIRPYLLEGVTGSGKTAVYIEIARHYLKEGKQVLFLVPEIGLTPQFIERIGEALAVPYRLIHSQVGERDRLNAWESATKGEAALIIGTRSALFTPFKNLGVIILDEAHDHSYLQQDGVRYSAHNSAIKRAQLLSIPILLGTATPTLETIYNVERGAYGYLTLSERIKGVLPKWRIIDCNRESLFDGLTNPLLTAIEERLVRKEQVLVFLNRRGFSPVLYCGGCGWMAECDQCSAFLTYHRSTNQLHCHHCDQRTPSPAKCPNCGDNYFQFIGEGTQRIEKVLADAFPLAKVMRFDRDAITNNRTMEAALQKIENREVDIMIGTQMLAKGHDFENLSLVVLLNGDGLFFSNDFRADEKLAQLLTQVSGRAGRSKEHQGELIVQTYFPDHDLFKRLPVIGYHQYAKELLEIRKLLQLPPISFQALLQAEARSEAEAVGYLSGLIEAAALDLADVQLTPIIPNSLNRRQGYYRVHAVMQSNIRQALHQNIYRMLLTFTENRRHDTRFFVDIDPLNLN